MTYQTAKGPVMGHRVRTTRLLDGVPQGLHVYAIIVGQRLIGIRASHPKVRDAAVEIDQFAEALAAQVSAWDSVDAPAKAALIPAKRLRELVKVRITQPRDRFLLARADAFVQALLADVGRH